MPQEQPFRKESITNRLTEFHAIIMDGAFFPPWRGVVMLPSRFMVQRPEPELIAGLDEPFGLFSPVDRTQNVTFLLYLPPLGETKRILRCLIRVYLQQDFSMRLFIRQIHLDCH